MHWTPIFVIQWYYIFENVHVPICLICFIKLEILKFLKYQESFLQMLFVVLSKSLLKYNVILLMIERVDNYLSIVDIVEDCLWWRLLRR